MNLEVPFPPTVNNLFPADRYGKRRLSADGQKYRKNFRASVLEQHGLVKCTHGDVLITVELFPPDRRRRDIDNYHKAILDCLVHCGLMADDSQVKELHTYMRDPVPEGKAVLVIERVIDQDAAA